MSKQHNLEQVKERLKALDDLFELANDFATGNNGLPKNGATAVCLHKLRAESVNALKALDDPKFAEELTRRHLHEHTITTMLRIRGVIE